MRLELSVSVLYATSSQSHVVVGAVGSGVATRLMGRLLLLHALQ